MKRNLHSCSAVVLSCEFGVTSFSSRYGVSSAFSLNISFQLVDGPNGPQLAATLCCTASWRLLLFLETGLRQLLWQWED